MEPTRNLLGERTLVLNRSWYAIATTTVRRAISLVYQDTAHFICHETYEPHDFESWQLLEVNGDPCIRGVDTRLRLPQIIALSSYDGRPKRAVPFSRRNLYRRDEFTCQYCAKRPGSAELTIDHIVPRSQGGKTNWENCVLACVDCNKRKANRSLADTGMRLIRRQKTPQWSWDVELSAGSWRRSWDSFLRRRSARNGNGNGR